MSVAYFIIETWKVKNKESCLTSTQDKIKATQNKMGVAESKNALFGTK